MFATSAYGIFYLLALILIVVCNLVVVGFMSILTVSGNGGPGGLYWVGSIGGSYVLAFAYAATRLHMNGDHTNGVGLAISTIPSAFITFWIIYALWSFFSKPRAPILL